MNWFGDSVLVRFLSVVVGVVLTAHDAAATLRPAFSVTITVLDAETNLPIADFCVVPAPSSRHAPAVTWQRQHRQQMTETGNTFFMKRGWPDTVLRIEADGYMATVSKPLPRMPDQTLTVKLKKDRGITGVVLTPFGRPAADAAVALCTWSREVTVEHGQIRCGRGHELIRTDEDGRFHLPSEPDEWVLVIAHDSGYLERTQEELANSSELTLREWGHLKGQLVIGGQPVPDQKIDLGSGRGDVNVVLHYAGSATTDAQGRFQIGRLPPVRLYVSPMLRFGKTEAKVLQFSGLMQIKSGEVMEVTVPRAGETITGRIHLPDDLGLARQDLVISLSCVLNPPRISGWRDRPNPAWSVYNRLLSSSYGDVFRRSEVPIREDGTFEISGLPETKYTLQARARRKTDDANARPVAFGTRTVTLKAKPAKSSPQDIGNVILKER